jgi:hypothetical protein
MFKPKIIDCNNHMKRYVNLVEINAMNQHYP